MDSRLIAQHRGQTSPHCAGKTRIRFRDNGAFCGLPGCGARIAGRSATPFDLIDAFQAHLDVKHPAVTGGTGSVTSIGQRLGQSKVIELRSRI